MISSFIEGKSYSLGGKVIALLVTQSANEQNLVDNWVQLN